MSLPLWKRQELPQIACKPNCGECCGYAPCKDSELNAVADFAAANGIEAKNQGDTCPFYQDGECKVYPVRPFVCRLFGHCERLTCPHGINKNISTALLRKLNDSYGMPTRFLHELIPGGWPLLTNLPDTAQYIPSSRPPVGMR